MKVTFSRIAAGKTKRYLGKTLNLTIKVSPEPVSQINELVRSAPGIPIRWTNFKQSNTRRIKNLTWMWELNANYQNLLEQYTCPASQLPHHTLLLEYYRCVTLKVNRPDNTGVSHRVFASDQGNRSTDYI